MNPKDDFIVSSVKGNPAAVAFLRDLWLVCSAWDDLIDKDKVLTDAEINMVFWKALAAIPANPFYQQYFSDLFPLVKSMFVVWMASNELEGQPVLAKTMACHFVNVIAACALLVGGLEFSVEIAKREWLDFFLEN